MDRARFAEEFERIELHQTLAREQRLVATYESGLAHYRRSIEQRQYRLGRLDERLGS